MTNTETFFLTFFILTVLYGILLILLWKKFHERDLARLMAIQYIQDSAQAQSEYYAEEIADKEKQIKRLHELYKNEVVSWKRGEIENE